VCARDPRNGVLIFGVYVCVWVCVRVCMCVRVNLHLCVSVNTGPAQCGSDFVRGCCWSGCNIQSFFLLYSYDFGFACCNFHFARR